VFDLGNQARSFQGDCGNNQLVGRKQFHDQVREQLGKAFHLADLINDDESANRVSEGNVADKIFKVDQINAIFSYSEAAWDILGSQDAFLARDADQGKSCSYTFSRISSV
jgi:hypothetical protein